MFLVKIKLDSNTIKKKKKHVIIEGKIYFILFFNNLSARRGRIRMLIILKKIMSWNYVPFGKRCREQVCSIFLEKKQRCSIFSKYCSSVFIISVFIILT